MSEEIEIRVSEQFGDVKGYVDIIQGDDVVSIWVDDLPFYINKLRLAYDEIKDKQGKDA